MPYSVKHGRVLAELLEHPQKPQATIGRGVRWAGKLDRLPRLAWSLGTAFA